MSNAKVFVDFANWAEAPPHPPSRDKTDRFGWYRTNLSAVVCRLILPPGRGLWLALHDILFLYGVLTVGALGRYHKYARLIDARPHYVSARHNHRERRK